MFIDQAKIYVKGGSGGKGCRSFYRDKYQRRGIADGGDGGRGANIILKADRNVGTLLDFHYNRHFYGLDGGNGSGKNKKGKDAVDTVICLPCGTIVKDASTGCILRDLTKNDEEFIAAYGGSGGLGNRRRQEPSIGEPGEERELVFDFKLIADVGLVGFPNAGKSTLISAVSGARPKIANYPFTTKFPILGVVRQEEKNFVIADIPGLIKGSSFGRGLGDKFLRHIERTRALIHLVDMSGLQARDPIDDYKVINKELLNYSKEVYKKPQIIAANKMDLEGSKANLERFKRCVRKKIYPISALKKEGLEALIEAAAKKI